MMTGKPSPFVQANGPWIIRKALSDYLRAKNMFDNMDREISTGRDVSFDYLKKLSDILYTIKEDLYLIFKRVIDPPERKFEKAAKITPNDNEIEFINNAGLLFHKATVARELKYVMEYYATDSKDYKHTKDSLDTYWIRIRELFDDGIEMIKHLLVEYSKNIIVLDFLLEKERYVTEALGESLDTLLQRIEGKEQFDDAYVRVGKYCLESGWRDRAKKYLGEALKINPKNVEAGKLLAQPGYFRL
ncbi:MAG: hypothetical protein GWP06_12100 [Actinobacteria bacterium]|nr:hypothetical protein [Actinomycetota bacterium]